jgi:hypothetical protein
MISCDNRVQDYKEKNKVAEMEDVKNYTEIWEYVADLSDVVILLQEYKEKGKLAKFYFNGHWLYSDTVTMDSAYLEVTGRTKAEHERYIQEQNKILLQKFGDEKRRAKENIPIWIEQGHKVFPKDKWQKWDEIVPIRASDLYNGMELDCVLEVQEIINKSKFNVFEEVKKCMERQGHSGMSRYLMCAMIREFCTNGDKIVCYLEEENK